MMRPIEVSQRTQNILIGLAPVVGLLFAASALIVWALK